MVSDTDLIIDLSKIFNENGYIDEKDYNKYKCNKYVTNITLIQSNDLPIKIDTCFLFCYEELISIDATKLINVVEIEDLVFADCCNLTNCNMNGSFSLITIGKQFLSNCCKLLNFSTTGLTKITTIGNCFLYKCFNLTNFDATGLTSLTTIEEHFLIRCNEKLTITIKNPPNCLYERLSQTNYKIIQLYDKPIVHLINDCVI